MGIIQSDQEYLENPWSDKKKDTLQLVVKSMIETSENKTTRST